AGAGAMRGLPGRRRERQVRRARDPARRHSRAGRHPAAAQADRPGPGQEPHLHRKVRRRRGALRIGLVDQVVPDAEVYRAATTLAGQFVSGPALALRAAKEAIDTGLDLSLDAGLEIERLHFAALFATEDQKLGMESF